MTLPHYIRALWPIAAWATLTLGGAAMGVCAASKNRIRTESIHKARADKLETITSMLTKAERIWVADCVSRATAETAIISFASPSTRLNGCLLAVDELRTLR